MLEHLNLRRPRIPTHNEHPHVHGGCESRRNIRVAYSLVVTIVLAIYSYPVLRTAAKTGSLHLPAVSAPDLGVYLSISKLEHSSDGSILNPYYHVSVPNAVSYLKFRSGPLLFGLLNRGIGGRLWFGLFVWNVLWWLFLCLSVIWLLSRFLPHSPVDLVLAGLALLTLFSFESAWRTIAGWVHGSFAWPATGLPYIRPFSPQIGVPLLVCYLALQIRALEGTRVRIWAAMAVLQFVAFTAFPYATLMMAGLTAVAASWYVFASCYLRKSTWKLALGYLLASAVLDAAFTMYGAGSARLTFPGHESLVDFQPAVLGSAIGKTWILIAILVLAVAVNRKIRSEVKWPLVGLGLGTLLFALGDAVVPERFLFLNNHIAYFYEPTILILSLFLLSAHADILERSGRLRILSLSMLALCCAYGALLAHGNYRSNLNYNIEQADLANWFEHTEVSAQDLVITTFATYSYDDCEWIPLVSSAEVLYCRNAQLTLTPELNRDVQRFREVLYLYFDGKDHNWLEKTSQIERYGFYGEISSYRAPDERAARISAVRQEMLPIFYRTEDRDPSITAFFRRFRQVWVIQNQQNAELEASRLRSYFDLKEQFKSGTLRISCGTPK